MLTPATGAAHRAAAHRLIHRKRSPFPHRGRRKERAAHRRFVVRQHMRPFGFRQKDRVGRPPLIAVCRCLARKSEATHLFSPQCNHGVLFGGAARGDNASHQGQKDADSHKEQRGGQGQDGAQVGNTR